MNLQLPTLAAEVIAGAVRDYGHEGVETGGFFLGARNDASQIACLALAGEKGIVRHADYFTVSSAVMELLAEWAVARDFVIVGQFHSHRLGSWLSLIDEAAGYRVEDFVSVVVPHFASPPTNAADWGWYQFGGGTWRAVAPVTGLEATIEVVKFDEKGVQ